MIDELMLLSGNDIPFAAAGLSIHAPRIKEIAMMGEENFFQATELLNFSKDILPEEDKKGYNNQTNFDILIAMMEQRNKDAVMQKNKNCLIMLLALLFPSYYIHIRNKRIELEQENNKEIYVIDNDNFEEFLTIVDNLLVIDKNKSMSYKTEGELAAKIAEKFRNRHKRLAQEKKNSGKIDIISRYVSILATGQQKDMNDLLNYTFYQLNDEFKRYQLKMHNDYVFKARLAGAKDVKDAEDWMQDIHSDKNN